MRRPQEMAVGGSEDVASPKMRRTEAQTSTPAKLAAPHTAAHEFRHQLLNFRSCTSLRC
jgi:hypothetical protein